MIDAQSTLVSLVLQLVASLCWAVGAAMAGPRSAADILQLAAAIAWSCANVASAWSMKIQYELAGKVSRRLEMTDEHDITGDHEC